MQKKKIILDQDVAMELEKSELNWKILQGKIDSKYLLIEYENKEIITKKGVSSLDCKTMVDGIQVR